MKTKTKISYLRSNDYSTGVQFESASPMKKLHVETINYAYFNLEAKFSLFTKSANTMWPPSTE